MCKKKKIFLNLFAYINSSVTAQSANFGGYKRRKKQKN